MLTSDALRSIMPALPAAKSAAYLPSLDAAMTEFEIDAPPRAAAFLAQLAHESSQLRFMEEIWGPTAQQLRYEPESTLATTLGNTQAGDGKRFKGRGPIQITGRANYQRFGGLLGVDLLSTPEQAALPELAFRIAGLYWSKKGLNELADQATDDAFREITRRINGGFNGLADRQQFYATACTALGVTGPPVAGAQDTQRTPATRGMSTAREMSATRGTPATTAAEPVFERGFEAISTERQPRRRKAAPARARQTRKIAKAQKAGPRRKARKAAPAKRARRSARTKTKKSKR
jgi:predicted chitinase